MSRYYFHIRNAGTLVRDEEGMECRNLRAALAEAHASARDAAKATLYRPNVEPISIEIEDEDGEVFGNISFVTTRH
jgi:hypothetical protein